MNSRVSALPHAYGHRFLGKLAAVRTPPLMHALRLTSRSKRWIVDRAALKRARAEDVLYADSEERLAFLNIFFANGSSSRARRIFC